MGVPSFYRWLKDKYPNVVVKATEDEGECINTSLPIPNGIEFDNLYLDLNGIIHPGLCPEDQPSRPETFEDVFNNIFDYVDNLFSIVRPRKLLYMAIDGVAPWAKMNQQRSGRFRTIKARERHDAEIERLMREFVMEGKPVYDLLHKDESEVILDSHMITPGTEFMYKFSKALRSYVISRTKSDPGWRDIKVIISDANVPGEGEHKIMSFIRQQRNVSTGYNPNTRHCVCGLDADLIMLALATHEVHFSILREEPPTIDESSVKKRAWFKKPFEFVHVWILREYLELDMKISDPPPNLEIDLERIVDDFIFMCFFVGNDFLPRMPSLEVHEGAIDLLMTVYKKEFKNFGGYLLDMSRLSDSEDKRNGYINLSRVEKFILLVGSYEDKIFKKRIYLRERQLRYLCNDSNKQDEHEGHALSSEKAPTSIDSADISEQDEHEGHALSSEKAPTSRDSADISEQDEHEGHALSSEKAPTSRDSADISEQDEHEGHALSSEKAPTSRDSEDISEIEKNTYELIEKYNDNLLKSIDLFKNGQFVDKVRLGTAGWKERYYKEKFSANTWRDIESLRKELVKKYTEGLLWVLLYYFSAVPSWSWFYPYHYSPFASDLKGLAEVSVEFQKGSPLKPFDNLLAVLPLKSAHVLPKVYQALMTDDEFKLIDFYPTDFDIDLDGKRFRRQGIYKLPFVEEKRLLSETKELESGLLEDEALRNRNNVDQLYVSSTHKLASQILSLTPHENEVVEIDTSMSVGISGYIHLPNEDTEIVHREVRNSIEENSVLCVSFEMCDDVHIPGLLDGVILPIKSITEEDIIETKLWHGFYSNKPSNRLQYESCRKSYSSTDSASSISPKMIHEGYQSRFTTDSSSEVIYKGAGVGWGAGRGKVNDTSNINKHIESRERVILPRNGETSGANNVRQQRINFRDPSHQGRGQHGATVSPTSSWKHSSATSSVQGRGRSRHSSVEESGSH